MAVTRFFVPHRTGTYADALEAVGLALLCHHLIQGIVDRIIDAGPYYEIRLQRPVGLEEWPVERLRENPGYPYFATEKDFNVPPNFPYYDYEREKQRANIYWEKRKKAQQTASAEVRQIIEADAPDPRHNLFKNMYVLQGFNSHNRLLHQLAGCEVRNLCQVVRTKLQGYRLNGGTGPAIKQGARIFNPKLKAVQVLNPIVGKGINRDKPNGTVLQSLPPGYVDWFSEYLRYLGVNKVANAYNVGKKDIKMAVLMPADISFFQLNEISDIFVRLPFHQWTSCQLDIQAIIGLAESLIKHSPQQQEAIEQRLRKTPKNVVKGIATAYFKSLGTGKALANVNLIGLPGWFPIESGDDVSAWLAILEEHRHIIERLNEEWTEEAALLYQYRDFISAGDLREFLGFAASYAAFVFKKVANNSKKKYRLFSLELLKRLVISMETPKDDYRLIVNNNGFRVVADAIRRATVAEQYRKSKGNQVYEIHYGLLADLKRKARSKRELVSLLGDFISAYNYENARKAELSAKKESSEREGLKRPSISDINLTEVVGLIEAFGAEPVAMLLAAFGSAKREN